MKLLNRSSYRLLMLFLQAVLARVRTRLSVILSVLGDLERIAAGFPGVEKVYAIQAGREIRIFVNPGKVSDLAVHKLAREIAERVQARAQISWRNQGKRHPRESRRRICSLGVKSPLTRLIKSSYAIFFTIPAIL